MNPLNQFKIHDVIKINLGIWNFSLTNAACTLILGYVVTLITSKIVTAKLNTVPGKRQIIAECFYNMVKALLLDSAGKEAIRFLPPVMTLFTFIAVNNVLSAFPFVFATTSHFSVTLALSTLVFLIVMLTGFIRNGWKYFSVLLPRGTPWFFAPLMIIIELFAYLARPLSLAVRLAANIIAGHVVTKVLSSLVVLSGFFGFLPFMLLTILSGFEILIAVLQAYIFTVLTCTYLSEAYNLH
tara:strand:- start:2316 stop:3035 length:720 start_codon:yes stop_codon:yes gene_type:complete